MVSSRRDTGVGSRPGRRRCPQRAHVIRAAQAPKSPKPVIGERRGGTADFLLDADRFRLQRLDAFAHRFTDLSCRGRFGLGSAERPSWPATRPVYARQ